MIDELQIQKWIEERIQVLESKIESLNLIGPAPSATFESYRRGKTDAIRSEIGHLRNLIQKIPDWQIRPRKKDSNWIDKV